MPRLLISLQKLRCPTVASCVLGSQAPSVCWYGRQQAQHGSRAVAVAAFSDRGDYPDCETWIIIEASRR